MNLPTFTMLGAGPTVLMLHGVAGSHLAFAPQVESLAMAGYRAVAWDMPGYGHSAPIEPYTFKGLAERCIALIQALQPPQPLTLLGHGMGGMVAQEVIARRPELVGRLVLCGTTAAFAPAGPAADAAEADFIARYTAPLDEGGTMAQLAERMLPQLVGPGSLPEGLRLAQHCMGQLPAATWRRALEACTRFDRQASLEAIHVPTLLLAGEYDRVAPAQRMRQMSRAIAGSTFFEMPGIGHLQNLEAPDEFDTLVLNFLALPRWLH